MFCISFPITGENYDEELTIFLVLSRHCTKFCFFLYYFPITASLEKLVKNNLSGNDWKFFRKSSFKIYQLAGKFRKKKETVPVRLEQFLFWLVVLWKIWGD